MGLWGTTHDSATNKPKFLPEDENSDYSRADSYATQAGWVMQNGAATGNDNASADLEVLVAIGGLAGATDTTGLRAPTVTDMRFVIGATATTDMTAGYSLKLHGMRVLLSPDHHELWLIMVISLVRVRVIILLPIPQLIQLQTGNDLQLQVKVYL